MAPKPLPRPDLVVESLGVERGTVDPGAPITLSATVRNRGSGEGAATTLRWYRSSDSTIAANDIEVGSQSFSTPAAAANAPASIRLAAPGLSGTYYYGACVDAVTDESDTTNNCSTSVQVTVSDVPPSPDPDLVVVAPSTSDSRPTAGASFTLSATVRNDGNSDAPAILRYYHSTDAAITTADARVGTEAVASLAPRGSASESVDLAAPATSGKHYYGACVDAVAGEADTTNNCSTSVQVTVSDAPPPTQGDPDLVVAAPLVTDSRPTARASFTLSATVRNDGNGAAPATTLRYYRSTDAAITTADTAVGTGAVSALAPSGGVSGSVDLTAPSNSGTYYYGACVDAVVGEADTTDNCSTSVQITISDAPPSPQRRPDLMVAPPSTSDRRPIAGASFTLSATVRNDGAADAPATTLRYYRSTDAAITTADTEVGTDTVASLAATATAAESVDLTAPSNSGTYYYGACVDVVEDEADSTNNCSAAVQVEVVERPLPPDLVVEHAGVTPSSINAGDRFVITVRVRNRGAGNSPVSPTLRYYYSRDAVISADDREVGTDYIGPLAASASTDEALYLNAPSNGGTYYYGACVGTVPQETSTTNNCSSAAALTVKVPPPQPDLVVAAPAVTDSRPAAGASFTLSATVRNDGDGAANGTTLRYYRSTDAAITTTDTEVGTDAVTALAAAATAVESVGLTAPSDPGTYYYGACVDAVTDESDTTNNCSTSVQVTIPDAPPPPQRGAPDLVVAAPAVTDSRPAAGASFTLSATVRNDGDGAANGTTLRYYRSTDAAITTTDTEVGTDAVTALAAAATAVESVGLTAPSDPGTYYYGACVDAVTDESDTTNNCSTSVQVTIPDAPPPPQRGAPDLVVAAPAVTDSRPAAGASFTLSATVRNDGDGAANGTTLRYYRSTDAAITTTDTEVGTDAVTALAAAATAVESVGLTAPSDPGTYYYGACVDAVTDESDTTNNCSTSVQVTIPDAPPPPQRGAPDLVVAAPAVTDSRPAAGASFTLSATVRNDGDGAANGTTLRYYRSTDAAITTTDTEVGTDAVTALAAAATAVESVGLTAPSDPGTYYYGACVDAVTDESDTSNNCSAAVTVTVETKADLVVATPSVTDSRPAAGTSFTLSATVRNDGHGDAPTTTLRFYRSTYADFRRSSIQVGTDEVEALAASESASGSVDLTAPSDPGLYYYGAYVDAVAGEADRTNNYSTSVRVEVVSQAPDLVVQFSAIPGRGVFTESTISIEATVRNGGADDAPASTLRFYRSADATITTSDTALGTAAVAQLAGAATASARLAVTVSATPGTYYYGACVDAVAGEADSTNNCSAAAPVEVVERPLPPDLVVEHAGVTPSSVDARDQFVITVTVRNRGTGDSPVSPTLRYYYSLDAVISSDDREVGTDFIGPLAAGRSTNEALYLNAPWYGGTYYYGACVGTVPQETSTTNNCSSAAALTVAGEPRPQPDLVVESPYATIVSPVPAQVFTVGARVRNNGTAGAAATTLRWRRSSDATITASDTEVGTSAVDGLSAFSGSSSESVKLTAPSNAGTYYYGACVDAVTDESDTTNNCSSSVKVTVSVPPPFTSYYGAYALTIIGGLDNPAAAVGLVVDQRSEQEALNAAQQACQAAGGSVSSCSNAHSFQQCAAVVFGTDHLTSPAQNSGLSPHDASTLAAAESDALTYCRSQWSNCTIAASGCNSPAPEKRRG